MPKAKLRRDHDVAIYLNADVPDGMLIDSGMNFHRTATAEEYERLARSSVGPVAYLEIVIDEPVVTADSLRSGISYSCENRTAIDGLQRRSGVVIELDGSSFQVTSESTFDQ